MPWKACFKNASLIYNMKPFKKSWVTEKHVKLQNKWHPAPVH